METVSFWRSCDIFGARLVLVQEDDPAWDSTDAAHPAWWRGQEHAAKIWSERVETLMYERDELLEVVKDLQNELSVFETTKHELGCAKDSNEVLRGVIEALNGNLDDIKVERDKLLKDKEGLSLVVKDFQNQLKEVKSQE